MPSPYFVSWRRDENGNFHDAIFVTENIPNPEVPTLTLDEYLLASGYEEDEVDIANTMRSNGCSLDFIIETFDLERSFQKGLEELREMEESYLSNNSSGSNNLSHHARALSGLATPTEAIQMQVCPVPNNTLSAAAPDTSMNPTVVSYMEEMITGEVSPVRAQQRTTPAPTRWRK